MTKAQKGDLIRIVSTANSRGLSETFDFSYSIGDILEVEQVSGTLTVTTNKSYLYDHEYEIYRRAGEEDDTMTNTKAQKGDLIRVVSLDNGKGQEKAFDSAYSIGDILEVEHVSREVTVTTNKCYLFDHEFEIHRKAGEEDSPTTNSQDAVKQPAHYTQGKFETIEVIEEISGGYGDGFTAYNIGNVLKYIARAPHKHDNPIEDLRKAERYIQYAIAHEQRKIDGK